VSVKLWKSNLGDISALVKQSAAGIKRKLGSSTRQWVSAGVAGYETFAKVGQFLATATTDQLDALSIFGDPSAMR
jgi:hypothetical protein